ncbi:MAG: SprT-like domain-containing protein [Vicingaceae bacterium]
MPTVLLKYIPEASLPLVAEWLKAYKLHLKISKSRKTKLGDFRPANGGKPARISVNGDLNPYHFLITLTHEVAHAAVWEKYRRKALPHGKEWQNTYSQMLDQMRKRVDFPKELNAALDQHLNQPKASSCSDPNLYRALKKLNPQTNEVLLEDLAEGSIFSFHKKRVFKKGAKRRSRFECVDQKNKKLYLISGLAEVEKIESEQLKRS